jgi:serine/threonine-protein kinase
MSPEQWAFGGAASPSGDIYAATATFVECVTGRPPYVASDMTVLRELHEHAPIPEELLPEPLHDLARRGLAKDPAARPADAGVFLRELEAAAAAGYGDDWEERGRGELARRVALLLLLQPGSAAPAAGTSITSTRLGGAERGSRKVLIGSAAGLLVVAGIAAVLLWPTDAPHPRPTSGDVVALGPAGSANTPSTATALPPPLQPAKPPAQPIGLPVAPVAPAAPVVSTSPSSSEDSDDNDDDSDDDGGNDGGDSGPGRHHHHHHHHRPPNGGGGGETSTPPPPPPTGGGDGGGESSSPPPPPPPIGGEGGGESSDPPAPPPPALPHLNGNGNNQPTLGKNVGGVASQKGLEKGSGGAVSGKSGGSARSEKSSGGRSSLKDSVKNSLKNSEKSSGSKNSEKSSDKKDSDAKGSWKHLAN